MAGLELVHLLPQAFDGVRERADLIQQEGDSTV